MPAYCVDGMVVKRVSEGSQYRMALSRRDRRQKAVLESINDVCTESNSNSSWSRDLDDKFTTSKKKKQRLKMQKVNEVLLGFEPRLSESKSEVLTTRP